MYCLFQFTYNILMQTHNLHDFLYTVIFGVSAPRPSEWERSHEDISDRHRRWKQLHSPLQFGL